MPTRTKKPAPSLAAHPIAAAVEPLKAASIQQAVEHTTRWLDSMRRKVEAEPDVNKLAPHPSQVRRSSAERLQRFEEDRARELHNTVMSLTVKDPDRKSGRYGEEGQPYYRVWNPTAAEERVAQAIETATATYEAFVAKLVAKTEAREPVAAATVAAQDGVWTESILTVVLQSGAREFWKTQLVWNTSVLGKPYIQYPTRQLTGKRWAHLAG